MHCSSMMKLCKNILQQLLLIVLLQAAFSINSTAQRITYSEPEREDSRRTDFEIIGKVNGAGNTKENLITNTVPCRVGQVVAGIFYATWTQLTVLNLPQKN